MNSVIFASFLVLAVSSFVQADFCPDQKSRCSSTQTCCPQEGGGYGCCPYNGAVCCSDQRHCCPSNTVCDVARSRCVPQTRIPFLFGGTRWSEVKTNEEEVKKMCPDGKQKCPDSYTCCGTNYGGVNGFACCPIKNAVCCSDGVHCCPSGANCNVASGKCQFPGFANPSSNFL